MVKKIINRIVAFAIVLSVFTMAFSVRYKAADFVLYPETGLSVEYSYSVDGPYINGNVVTDAQDVFTCRIKINFDDFLIQGNSDFRFAFTFNIFNNEFKNVSFDALWFYDTSGARVYGLNSSSNIIVSSPIDDNHFDISSSSFSFGLSRDVKISYCYIYLDTVCIDLDGSFTVSDLTFEYRTPTPEEEIVNPSPADKDKTDNFGDNMEDKSSEMDDLVADMDSMYKPDSDSFNTDLSGVVSDSDVSTYSAVLSTITESKLVFSMLTILFTVALVGYALFGKRG